MTTDEALAWARATENERWALVRDDKPNAGYAYGLRKAECLETLAQEVERLRSDWETAVANAILVPAAETCEADIRYADSGAPTLTSGTAYCPECVRLKAELDAIAEDGTDEHHAAVGLRTALAQARADLARAEATIVADLEAHRFYRMGFEALTRERQEMRAILYRPAEAQSGTVTAEFDAQPQLLDAVLDMKALKDRAESERDALAKRWEALRHWLMDLFDADTNWDGDPKPNSYMRVEAHMRELEAQRG